jgi:hypothetical protein
MAKLTGEALLAYVQEYGSSTPENQLAIATGYCTKKRDSDVVIPHKQQMFRALLSAKGLGTFVTERPVGTPRKPSGSLQAGGRGLVSLTAAYTRQLGVAPGDRVVVQAITDEDVVRVSGPALIIHKAEDPTIPAEGPGDDAPEEEEEDGILGATPIDPSRLQMVA